MNKELVKKYYNVFVDSKPKGISKRKLDISRARLINNELFWDTLFEQYQNYDLIPGDLQKNMPTRYANLKEQFWTSLQLEYDVKI